MRDRNETDFLCKCNNCGTVMIDENPQINAKKKKVTGKVVFMEYFKEDDMYYLGCPKCKTDEFLTDI